MAKKNSSKTATEKAIQSSEPKVMSYRGWKGVNFVDSPLTWNPLETGQRSYRQSDLPANYLLVQNNVETSPLLGLETRHDSMPIGKIPDDMPGFSFTGICTMVRHWLFAVVRETSTGKEHILYRSLLDSELDEWEHIYPIDADFPSATNPCNIKEIGFYEGNLVATIEYAITEDSVTTHVGKLSLAKLELSEDGTEISILGMDWTTLEEDVEDRIVSTPYIEDPEEDVVATLTAVGMESSSTAPESVDDKAVVRVEVIFCYVNRMGSTLSSDPATIYTEYSPALWSSAKYLSISNPGTVDENVTVGSGISGIDFYARDTENTDYVFAGHIDIDYSLYDETAGGTPWVFNWLGNMTDISQWENSQLQVPSENNTQGPNVTHFTAHDSKMYYWGEPGRPYRLYIGGNPGAEFSVARGLGGAWIDIEPGSGYEIAGTAKWKTVQGANIVTIMCGHRNTNRVKRFNLVETNITITNEISYKGYMYEEVSNVTGCNSRYGYGVFADGLYSLNRYGLMLTTMAMEYNSQMRNQDASEVIKPIFTERIGNRLRDGRLVCIDNVIYIALSEDTSEDEPTNLDNVILCYDMGSQAWYTYTCDEHLDEEMGYDSDLIHHIFAVDSDEYIEGLGTITDKEIRLYPTTGIQDATVPEFQVLIETGELIPKLPQQVFTWIDQLEFRFDYLVGDPYDPAEILIEGTDYYGRHFQIRKLINIRSRGNHGIEGELRDFTEWVKVGKLVESMRIRIKGRVRFRLTHINCKLFQQSDRIGTPYGYDAHDSYYNRHGGKTEIHHYIQDYNNLRRAIVS